MGSVCDHLIRAGLSVDVTYSIVRGPVDVEMERYTHFQGLLHQFSTELTRLLADKQTVNDTLAATMIWTDKVETELSDLDKASSDDPDRRLTVAHRIQAELEAQKMALEVARNQFGTHADGTKSDLGSSSDTDVVLAQTFTEQFGQLEQRYRNGWQI